MGKHRNSEQEQILFKFMTKHPYLANGFAKGNKAAFDAKWKHLTYALNSAGPPVKGTSGWKKSWVHWKSTIRKKLAVRKKGSALIVDDPYAEQPLLPVERQIAILCGLLKGGDEINESNSFENESIDIKEESVDVNINVEVDVDIDSENEMDQEEQHLLRSQNSSSLVATSLNDEPVEVKEEPLDDYENNVEGNVYIKNVTNPASTLKNVNTVNTNNEDLVEANDEYYNEYDNEVDESVYLSEQNTSRVASNSKRRRRQNDAYSDLCNTQNNILKRIAGTMQAMEDRKAKHFQRREDHYKKLEEQGEKKLKILQDILEAVKQQPNVKTEPL